MYFLDVYNSKDNHTRPWTDTGSSDKQVWSVSQAFFASDTEADAGALSAGRGKMAAAQEHRHSCVPPDQA